MPVVSLSGQVTWSGVVQLDRSVVVRKGATLRVLPGTTVRFRRFDWDGDGIGDGELSVEGTLLAEGTPDAPIVFASAEPSPHPSDWKYLSVNFAAGASLKNVRISHAYSGIQVHFSPAQITDCEFSHNVDGVRFSTARLRVEGCWIHDNTNGVRYEERGHPAEFLGNEISDNDVGIFAVAECRGATVFRGNNLQRNRCAVKLGQEQLWSLTFPDNYWGPGSDTEREAGVIDRRLDPRLGTVTRTPLLASPIPIDLRRFLPRGKRF